MLVDSTLLLPPLLTVLLSLTLSSPPVQAGPAGLITPLERTSSLGPLGILPHTPRDPRLRSFHRPFQVLVLHSEGLRHVLPPEAVTALPVVLPAHPQPLDGGALAGLQSSATCCSSDGEWRRVRSGR